MQKATLFTHAIALALLLVSFGAVLQTGSIDLAQHTALVDEIMKFGRIRPVAPNLELMVQYPPAAHWLAAAFGWLIGSALVSLWLIAIASVYVSYYFIGRMLQAEGSIISIPVFAALVLLVASTRSLVGWEVIGNFFYPQLVGMAGYFALLWFVLSQRTLSDISAVLLAGALNAFIYLSAPLVGLHLTGALAAYLAVDALCVLYFEKQRPWKQIAAAIVMTAASLAMLFLHPKVSLLIKVANNNGGLGFFFPFNGILLPAIAAAMVCAWNLVSGIKRYPLGRADRLLGAAGLASCGLMLLQWLVLATTAAGSDYAIKKHTFIVVTLGLINLTRILSSPSLAKRLAIPAWQPLFAIALASLATIVVFKRSGGIDLAHVVRMHKFAEHYAATSPAFRPGNTSVYAASASPINAVVIATSALSFPFGSAARSLGRINPDSEYLLVDRSNADVKCAVAQNATFAIIPARCLSEIVLDTPLQFGSGHPSVRYLASGWHAPESWGAWGSDSTSALKLNLKKQDYRLTINAGAFLVPGHESRTFDIKVNDIKVATLNLTLKNPVAEVSANIPQQAIQEGLPSTISFETPTPLISPKSVGNNPDERKLGVRLIGMVITPLN